MRITCGPYLQNVTGRSMTIMWHTDEPGTSVVEYEPARDVGWSAYSGRPNPTYEQRRVGAHADEVHAVTIDGLDQQWEYFYRVRSVADDGVEVVSEGASFRTAARHGAPFSFVTYGDDMGLPDVHQRNAQLARSHRPSIAVGAGDVAMDVIGRLRREFFDCTRELLAYTPWFATMGNHDSPNEGYFNYFSFPEPRYWYSLNYGCAHVIVLNSNMDYRPGSEQWVWLEHDLRASRAAPWTFVFLHHPPFCSNSCQIAATRVLCSLFEEHDVDVVYSAHATLYERFHPLTAGAYDDQGGVVYIVTGGGGYDMDAPTSAFWDQIHPFSAMSRAMNHILLTHVAPRECCLRAIDTDGRVVDTLTLTKPQRVEPPLSVASPQLPYPTQQAPGTVVAGLEEGLVRWILPSSQFSIDPANSRSGGNSVRWQRDLRMPVLPGIRRVIKDDGKAMAEAGGKRYEILAWVKTRGIDGGGVTVSLAWNGDMGFLDRAESEPLTGSNDWTRVSVTTPPLPRHVYWCRLVLSAKHDTTGTAWFDDASVEEIAAGG